jgi:lipopolysaccharide biosynthesis glycosyltransferase
VIYLDADTITRSSLAPLWNTDVTGKSLAAVVDPNTRTLGAPDGLQAPPPGSDPRAPFFNAGVMLVNLSHWRNHSIADRALTYLQEHGHVAKSMEQEALNACLLGDFVVLDHSWNVMNYWERENNIEEYPDLLERANIRHYEYKLKPWAYATHTMTHTQAEFFKYLDRTDWALWRPPLMWRPQSQ